MSKVVIGLVPEQGHLITKIHAIRLVTFTGLSLKEAKDSVEVLYGELVDHPDGGKVMAYDYAEVMEVCRRVQQYNRALEQENATLREGLLRMTEIAKATKEALCNPL